MTHDFLDRTTESQNVLCGRATIAVRRPRVTAPSAAAVGRARALPAWRAAALAARRAAGWSRRTPRVTWVLPRRGLKRWRAPTVAPADRRVRPRARASSPRGDIAAAQALSSALEWQSSPAPGGPASVRVEAGLTRCGATRRPLSPACWATATTGQPPAVGEAGSVAQPSSGLKLSRPKGPAT